MLLLFLLLLADQFEPAYHEGLTALNNNQLAVAESRLQSAAKLQPKNARVWLALAQTYSKLHRREAAQTAARNAEAFANEPLVFHGLAIYYSTSEDFRKAAELEARYSASTPEAVPTAVGLYLRAGMPKPAIKLAQKGLAARDNAELHNLLGKAFEGDGDPDRAIIEYKAAIQIRRYDEAYYFDLAQLQLKQQAFAAAVETLDAGRENFDKSAQLELAAGVAYYGLRRFPEAIDAFLRTIRLDPTVSQPYVFLGRMSDQAEGKLPEIEEAFARFAKTDPDNYLSSFLYGNSIAVENPVEATALLRKSIARNPQFWESHFELGLLLEREGKLAEAGAEIKRSIELNPKDPAPHYRLARIYDRLGKTTEARAERELHETLSSAGAVIK